MSDATASIRSKQPAMSNDIEPLLSAASSLGTQLWAVTAALFAVAIAFAALGMVIWRGLSRIERQLADSQRLHDMDRAEELLLRDELTQLEELAQRGAFEPALADRLCSRTVRVPGLSERGADLPVLASHYLAEKAARMGKVCERVSPASLERLAAHRCGKEIVKIRVVSRGGVMENTKQQTAGFGWVFQPAGARIVNTGPLQYGRRRDVFEIHAAIDLAFESSRFPERRRGRRVGHPAVEMGPAVRARGGHLSTVVFFGITADRRAMDISQMGQIHQIVDHEHVVRGNIVPADVEVIFVRLILIKVIDDLVFVGEGRITHPDPDRILSFDDGKRPDGKIRIRLLARIVDAFAVCVEDQTVITAHQTLFDRTAKRKLYAPVAAPVFKRGGSAVSVSEQDQRPVQDFPGNGSLAQFGGPCADVPSIVNQRLHGKSRHEILL